MMILKNHISAKIRNLNSTFEPNLLFTDFEKIFSYLWFSYKTFHLYFNNKNKKLADITTRRSEKILICILRGVKENNLILLEGTCKMKIIINQIKLMKPKEDSILFIVDKKKIKVSLF